MSEKNKAIIYKSIHNSIDIVFPIENTELSISQIIAKDVPANAQDIIIVNKNEIPEDRYFRNAWIINADKILDIDMSKAREIQKQKLRELREPLLKELDMAYQKADEANDQSEKAKIAAKKNKLRDITKNPEIELAENVEQLKQAGLKDLEIKDKSVANIAKNKSSKNKSSA